MKQIKTCCKLQKLRTLWTRQLSTGVTVAAYIDVANTNANDWGIVAQAIHTATPPPKTFRLSTLM